MQRGDAIALIGFMGSGKSSVGWHLARRLHLPRHDTDQMLTRRFGMNIAQIFHEHGEEAFRAAETEVLLGIRGGAAVVVTGGGIVLRPENVERLQLLGTIVSLTVDEETLLARVSRRATRPLLQTANSQSTLHELLRVREPLYRAAADFTVDTSALAQEEVADVILQWLEKNGRVTGK